MNTPHSTERVQGETRDSTGGGDDSISQTTDPVIELRIQAADKSREELDDEALVLMQILRDCIVNSNQLTGFLAGECETTRPVQSELSLLDATSSYLISILGPTAYGRARPTLEQTQRRADIHDRHSQAINKMRRLPVREEEAGDSPSQEGRSRFLQLVPARETGNRRFDVRMQGVLGMMLQLDGSSLGDSRACSGSSHEEQAQLEVDGSGQKNCLDDVD